MFIQSSSWITTLSDAFQQAGAELGATLMPAKVSQGSTSLGSNIAMLAHLPQDKQEATLKFMKWMTGTKQTVTSSIITGYQPTRHSAINSQEMQDVFKKNRLFKVASDQMEFAAPRPMELAYYEIGKILNTKFKKRCRILPIRPRQRWMRQPRNRTLY
ncbi:extracellular solute-binding protein [Paenibacillus periandrae]|uniref:extracellular solute-binding protein n=1 Tax=Paenibacillus periandrae TaxID=1761741 RepID=UPI001F08E91C|nr:extracellular solute-binding protein [Paenibacillus periandrae]